MAKGEQFWFFVWQWIASKWVPRADLSFQSGSPQDVVLASRDFWDDDPSVRVQPAWYYTGCYERNTWEQWHGMIDPKPEMGWRQS